MFLSHSPSMVSASSRITVLFVYHLILRVFLEVDSIPNLFHLDSGAIRANPWPDSYIKHIAAAGISTVKRYKETPLSCAIFEVCFGDEPPL